MSNRTDDSSTVSDSRRRMIIFRDGDACVLCGCYPIDVAHIVARKAGDLGQLPWVRGVASSLVGFRKDDHDNLLCLCPSHHRQFNLGYFAFVPSPGQRAIMIEFEESDFAARLACVKRGEPDPGRRLPQLCPEFEYIPIYYPRSLSFLHHPTAHDNGFFVFDTTDNAVCPLLHFRASHFALLAEAASRIGNPMRFQNARTHAAYLEVTRLVDLYNRRLGTPTPRPQPHASSIFIELLPDSPVNSRLLASFPDSPTIDVRPPGPVVEISSIYAIGSLPALVPSSSYSTDLGSSNATVPAIDDDDDNATASDDEFQAYAKEPAITREDIETRPRQYSTETLGLWRFSSANDIINGVV